MSRIIKFRAWDKEKKIMIYNVGFSFCDCGMMMELERPMVAEKGVFFTFPIDGFILLQFTGLLDKNGVEIWDGDILEYPNNNAGYGDPNEPDELTHVVKSVLDFIEEDWLLHVGVVIGNIFENPELLEKD